MFFQCDQFTMNKTVLLTGATGLLGRAIRTEFASDNTWNCIATGYSRSTGDVKKINLRDENEIASVLKDSKVSFTVAIHFGCILICYSIQFLFKFYFTA